MRKTFLAFCTITISLAAILLATNTNTTTYAKEGDAAQRPSAVFTNSTAISVTAGAANNAVPYPSAIVVSGMSGNILNNASGVKVTLNGYSHTFSDDLGVVLVAPNGDALLLMDGCGDDPDMVGVTFTLVDGAAALPNLTAWTAGNYKPTTYYTGDSFPAPGPLLAYGSPGPTGGGTATFASTFGGDAPNGTWNLYVRDFVTGDAGNIAGGWSLEITTDVAAPAQHVLDFNGDGKTDYSVVRNTGGGPSGQITWFNCLNGVAEPGCQNQVAWGIATDRFVPEDYDGDNKTDIAVWRAGAPGTSYFYILQSATNTVRADNFGQSGDDPTVVGDYDGDGKADPAVYRGGASAGLQSFWFYRGSTGANNGVIVYNVWGQNGDFPAPGDYDGDGKNDFVVQRNAGGGQAIFWTFLAGTGAISNTIFGTPTDVIVPGDYDGDGKTDIATIRGSGGAILWFYKPSTAPAEAFRSIGPWGLSATDFPVQGDYDGDGRTDVAVWRPNADPAQVFFFANGTTSGFLAKEWGQNGDYPVANFNAH